MAIVVSILAGLVPLNYLADMVSIGTLVAFIVVSVGVVILRVREPDLPRGFKVPGYPVTPVLSVLACLYILYSLHWYTWIAFSGWVAVVLVFYFAWGRHHSALADGGDGVIASAAPGSRRCGGHQPVAGRVVTVVVGYLAGKSGTAPLHLAVGAARTLRTSLTVTTIVPKPWTTPSPARVDAEYAAWADQLAADSAKRRSGISRRWPRV